MANKTPHPVTPVVASQNAKTPAGIVGRSAFGLSHMPTLPRPDTSVMLPTTPANHLQERLNVVPILEPERESYGK